MREGGGKKGNRGREGIDTRGNTEKSIGPSTAKLVTVPCTRIGGFYMEVNRRTASLPCFV